MVKISELPAATVAANADLVPIVDTSGVITKKITRANFFTGAALPTDTVTTAAVTDGSITSSKLDLDPGTQTVTALVSTVSGPYTDLSGGPVVTATIGANGLALVTVTSLHYNNTAASDVYHSFRVSGATTVAATDERATTSNGIGGVTASTTTLVTGLTAGSNTFTSQYRAGANTANFSNRSISVIPL